MTRRSAKLWLILACSIAGFCGYVLWRCDLPVLLAIARGNPNAGLWHDDPGNWTRAFDEAIPPGVEVIHSYFWQSDHFTREVIYFFEVRASSEWITGFLDRREAEAVLPDEARGFEVHYADTPKWFVPKAVESYVVWDRKGHSGSVWQDKKSGHLYFYGVHL
jgi:hypothetical protein